MEQVLVWTIVAAAAIWLTRGLVFRRRVENRPGECSHNCSSCAFAEKEHGCHTGSDGAGEDGGRTGGHRLPVLGAIGAVGLAMAVPTPARAADTTETFDAGAADVELYLGLDGLGNRRVDREVLGEVLVGYGLADRFSVYLASSLAANESLEAGHPDVSFGFLATPVDTERFDLDLTLELGAGADGFDVQQVVPGLEANLDLDSALGPWGLFLRAGLPLVREPHVRADGSTAHRTGHSLELNPGIHLAVAEGHQLLAEYALALVPGEDDEPATWENGGAALGYNVVLSETLELITQASLAPGDDKWVAGLMFGFIATLPGAGR